MIKNVFHPYCESCPDIKVESDTNSTKVYAREFNPYTHGESIVTECAETIITCEHYARCQHIYEYIVKKTRGEQNVD